MLPGAPAVPVARNSPWCSTNVDDTTTISAPILFCRWFCRGTCGCRNRLRSLRRMRVWIFSFEKTFDHYDRRAISTSSCAVGTGSESARPHKAKGAPREKSRVHSLSAEGSVIRHWPFGLKLAGHPPSHTTEFTTAAYAHPTATIAPAARRGALKRRDPKAEARNANMTIAKLA
jgi:hypothetical protein